MYKRQLLGYVGWANAALKPHAGRSDGNTELEVLRELVSWWLLPCLWRYSATKSWVSGGLNLFLALQTV